VLFAAWLVSAFVGVGLVTRRRIGLALWHGQLGVGYEERWAFVGAGLETVTLHRGLNWGFWLYSDHGVHILYIPLWPLVLVLAVLALRNWRQALVRPGHCPRCGYDLSATAPGAPCPECGSGQAPQLPSS
jgi:hypothetical protein